MSAADEIQAVVIDNGTHSIKGGFAGDDAPRAVFHSLVGHHKKPNNNNIQDTFIGHEVQHHRGALRLSFPIGPDGSINNWDDMEKIWHHIFKNELCLAPEEHPLLMTEKPLADKNDRERMCEILFETFHTPAFYVTSKDVLSLYASGRTTGVVVSCGAGVCRTVPIYEGFVLCHALRELGIGGQDLTKYLLKLLGERGFVDRGYGDVGVFREMKEKLGFVAFDFEDQKAGSYCCEKEYELPDGEVIRVNQERFCCAEPLFRPSLVGNDGDGLPELLYGSIMKCDINLRRHWYRNIVLSGSTSLFPGFQERLKKEFVDLAPSTMATNVIAPPERKYSAWIGGSILGSLPIFLSLWVSKEEYDENGPAMVNRKCI